MDRHKILYKDQRSHTPRQHNKINRELLEANRNKRRRDRYQDSRNISPSPIRNKEEVVIPLCVKDNKENVDNASCQQNPNSTRLAKIVCNATNPKKLTKQEAFLKRFVEWKGNKKYKKNLEMLNKNKPFVSATNGDRKRDFSSLVPRGHHKGFRPPIELENTINKEKVETAKNFDIKGRQSTYTAVPTPPRKQMDDKCGNKFPNARKALPANSQPKTLSTNKMPISTTKLTKTASKINANKSNIKSSVDKKIFVKKSPVSTAKLAAVNLAKVLEKGNTSEISTAQPPSRKGLRPRVLKMPPPPPSTRAATTAPNRKTGAIPKIKKRTEVVKHTKKSPLKSGGARLAQNLKAKKPLNTKKANLPAIQINGKKIINILKSNQPGEDMVIQTPRDFATLDHFDKFVTSTKIKNSSHGMENEGSNATGTSHNNSHGKSIAKRNILQETTITTLAKESNQNVEKKTNEDGAKSVVKKYNFIRYSEAGNAIVNDRNDSEETKVREEERKVSPQKTPMKCGTEEKPANYLSPYVSVTRGKVSLKTEKEKRNSLYLIQNVAESNHLPNEGDSQNNSQKYSVEVRRTLEAVRYFRKQLQDEIDRLHKLCDIWEVYKKENIKEIQNANGEDMINVTIGQTRLLTTKKFMQFKGLIDRCEAGATGIGDVEYDGSEGTKSIASGDLEGFWSMLSIQIDNLDKRFDNLNRWKINEWEDPDEKKLETKKKLTKVKKVKAAPVAKTKPNSALQQMIRKMQAEVRKKESKKNDIDELVVFTSSKLKQQPSEKSINTTPRKSIDTNASRRLSIIVKDRKYFSPSPTVISVSSPTRRSSKSSQYSPKMVKHLQKFNEALDGMQSSLGLRKSVLINENSRRMSLNQQSPMPEIINNDRKTINCTIVGNKENVIFAGEKGTEISNHNFLPSKLPYQSPLPTARKSILKTPGTAKSRLRNVIFNEKLRVKKFNFLINEDGNPFDGEVTHEEKLASSEEEPQSKDFPERTLTLRNRKVRLRPSCEIVIPQQ